jgi:hypothetical protein
MDEAYDGKQYGEILVVEAAEKITFRNLFKGEFVKQLKSRGIEAIPSYVILTDNAMLTREIILSDIDCVLITSLAGKSKRTVYYYKEGDTPYAYYNRIYPSIYDSRRTSSYDIEILFLQTKLYDVRSEKLIWPMTSESEYRYNMKSLDSAVTLVINKLRGDGLL